jgi:hypothetical protein
MASGCEPAACSNVLLDGFSLLEARMGCNQSADDLDALVRDRDEFPSLLR